MELGVMMSGRNCKGFVLVTVLIITAVGLLFGAGALLLFRYQCHLRIDRQHELEKVYAVRSVLNYIRTYNGSAMLDTVFTYHTTSDRHLRLPVKPVDCIFPEARNERHFDMGSKSAARNFSSGHARQYNANLDYEYGGVTNVQMRNIDLGSYCGIEFYDQISTNSVTWWINVGMLGTGGWLQKNYGRRYYFLPKGFVGDGETYKTRDVMRLCLIRNVTNYVGVAGYDGRRYGWPLSQEDERALVLQIWPLAGQGEDPGAELTLLEYWYKGGQTNVTTIISWPGRSALGYKGIQLAGRNVSLFDISQNPSAENLGNTYAFSETKLLPEATYDYFATNAVRGADGEILQAHELRAVFEVQAESNKRPSVDSSGGDILTKFRVTPAYQYNVFIEHPATVTNRATIAQRIGQFSPLASKAWYSVLTYDTHGTENKGFRKDEREAEKKRNGR